jgi:hypothetical protein
VEGESNKRAKKKDSNEEVIIVHKENVSDLRNDIGSSLYYSQGQPSNQERRVHTKLGARVTGTFKERSNGKFHGRSTMESFVDSLEKNQMVNLLTTQFNNVKTSGDQHVHAKQSQRNNKGVSNRDGEPNKEGMGPQMSLPSFLPPNVPRPPDIHVVPPNDTFSHQMENYNIEGDNFLDASDQGITGSSDSEMECVRETPDITQ